MSKMDVKIEYWKNRLLDVSKRNRMINCPLPKEGARVSRMSLHISKPEYKDLWSIFSEADQNIEFPVPENEIDSKTPGHPEVQAIIEDAIVRIGKAGKAAGILSADEKLARRYIELGAAFVAVGVDTTVLMRGLQTLASKFKELPTLDSTAGGVY